MPKNDATHERNRLDVLQSYGILDTRPEHSFDAITALAACIFDVPTVMISFIDKDRQWFKSRVGMNVSETPRNISFCDMAIRGEGVMEIGDATQDARFIDNPLVTGEPSIRFYAGAPLITDEGYALGTLCLIDQVARELTPQQKSSLKRLSEQVTQLLVLHKRNIELEKAFVDLEHSKQSLLETQTQFRESEQRLQFALNAAEIGDWSMDLKTNIAVRSLRHDQCFGYLEPVAEWGYETFLSHVHPEDRERVDRVYSSAMGGQGDYDVEFRVIWPDGSGHWLWSRGTFYRDGQGDLHRVAGIQVDITKRKDYEERLKLAASVFTNTQEGIIITDAQSNIVDVNQSFTEITGYTREEVLGRNPRFLKSGRHGLEFYQAMFNTLAASGRWSGEKWNRHKNGQVFPTLSTITAVFDAQGQIKNYMSVMLDMTRMMAQQQQLEHLAHFDTLTNLPNRVLLADRLNQAISQSQRNKQQLAVVYLDLDGFKPINDVHGHHVGDQMLVSISQRLKEAVREGDTLSRTGGDEFVAVLVGFEKITDCEPILERLLVAASQTVKVDDVHLQVSASIGVTTYPEDSSDGDQLIRHADQAMYLAKEAGKNRYQYFDVGSAVAVQIRRDDLLNIERALNLNQFVLYYQPKVNLMTNEVVGAEALIRWQHPERGLLAPGLFLPSIESHALSIAIGEWVIDSALAQLASWQAKGLSLLVSVNVDALQLQQSGFTERLVKLLHRYPQVQASQLQLEVLETSTVEDLKQVIDAMKSCQALGVSFALDDFGTGYSSLTYLRRLPAETLKIDQTFVRDMLVDPDDLAIVQGVIGLAKAFGREIVAEGVETAAHGEQLLLLGCELIQGYGVARPMPADKFPGWVAGWQTSPVWSA